MSKKFATTYNVNVKRQDFISAFSHAPIGMALLDEEGTWIAVNDQLCSIIGYAEEELLHKKIHAVTHPDDIGKDDDRLEQLREGHISFFNVEKRYIHKNGHVIWVNYSLTTSRTEQNAFDYYIAHVIDVTSDRLSQEQADYATAFKDLILEHIPDYIFVKDTDFRIVQANEAFLNLYPEDKRKNVIGFTTLEDYNDDDAAVFLQHDKLAFEQGASEVEEVVVCPDGCKRSLYTKKVRFKDNHGETYILGVSRDISYVKEAQRSLSKQEELLQLAGKMAHLGHWNFTLSDQRLLWSKGVYDIHDLDPDDCEPDVDRAIQFYHPDDRQLVKECLQKSIENIEPFDFELRLISAANIMKHVHAVGSPEVDERGEVISLFGTFQDITERKNNEMAMIRANKELEKFAYVATHDLKSPLRAIDALAHWISEDLAGKMSDDTAEKLKLLRSRVRRLETMLNDIFEYSKAGKITEKSTKVDLRELLDEVVSVTVLKEGFNISYPDAMPIINTAITPLQQVFANLLTNAVKHHDKDTGVIEVSCLDKGDWLEITCKDDGPGVPAQYHHKVFELFETLRPRDKTEGSGLGLPIIKKLVEWHGGVVQLNSPLDGDRGTEITFSWPKNMTT